MKAILTGDDSLSYARRLFEVALTKARGQLTPSAEQEIRCRCAHFLPVVCSAALQPQFHGMMNDHLDVMARSLPSSLHSYEASHSDAGPSVGRTL